MTVHDPLADPLTPALRRWVNTAAARVVADMFATPTRAEVARRVAEDQAVAVATAVRPRRPLSDLDKKVQRLLVKGLTPDLVAERLSIDREVVYNARKRLRAHGVGV